LSIIIRRLNGTLYLKEKKTLLATNLVTSRLTACLNADGTKWWVWAVGYNSNTFHKFLIGGPDMVEGPFSQQIGPPLFNLEIDVSQTAYSHDARTFGINSLTISLSG